MITVRGVLLLKNMGRLGPLSYHQLYTNLTFLCSSLTWFCIWVSLGCHNKIPHTVWLKLQIFIFSHSGDYELKVPSVLVLVRSLDMKMATFLLYSHTAFSQILHGEKERPWLSFLLEGHQSYWFKSCSKDHSLNHLLIDLISKYSSIRDYSFNIWILKDTI